MRELTCFDRPVRINEGPTPKLKILINICHSTAIRKSPFYVNQMKTSTLHHHEIDVFAENVEKLKEANKRYAIRLQVDRSHI